MYCMTVYLVFLCVIVVKCFVPLLRYDIGCKQQHAGTRFSLNLALFVVADVTST